MIDSNKNIEKESFELETPKKFSFREDLKNLVKRYYSLMGYIIKQKKGMMEIYEPHKKNPTFRFVFERKSSIEYPNSDLLTFNNKKLDDLVKIIKDKGKIAKAYIPFEFEAKKSFSSSLNKLISKSNNENPKYIINGDIESLGHYISYVPFLIFLVKIELVSIETFTIIEKSVIPLIKPNSKIKIDEVFYKNKIKSYFDTSNPNLTSSMPVEGEILDINEKDFKKIVKKTVKEIELSVDAQKEKMKGQMNERLRKEHGILENYYDQRIYEIENQIESAKERGAKKEDINGLENTILEIKNEQEFKKNEYESIYQLETSYEILGTALIYVPAIFYFKCKISSPFGTKEINLEYDIFDDEIIAPKCACGEPINQGIICENLHLSCLNCSYSCNECNKQICRYCDIKFCKFCNVPLCSDHYYECSTCKEKGINNIWVCKSHLHYCDNCETSNCPDCTIFCIICEKSLCKSNNECSFECPSCHEYVCLEHTFICTFDNKKYCLNEEHECSLCHQKYCSVHCSHDICRTCSQSSNEKFYKFIRYKKGKLTVPSEINLSKDDSLVKKRVKRYTYNIPSNQIKVKMGENKNYNIFLIKKITGTYTITHNITTNKEKIFFKPSFIGKLINLLGINKIQEEIEIIEPIVSYPSKKSKKSKKKSDKLPKCSNCNKSFSEDYKICPYCGQKLEI